MKFALQCSFLFFLSLSVLKMQAQQEANTWYFGRFLGLDFNSGSAIALNDGQLNTTEGVATISNQNGDILFYTDGIKIWNRLHQVMPNGTGLFGNVSSTQSAVIVPFINDTTRYYVFTVDAQGGPRGLTYSIVNMTLDNGKGDVEIKNTVLQLNVVEKITAVKHCNNRDIWVLTHGTVSDTYYSFLVSATGVNTTPVISHTGAVLPATDSATLGYMKASPDGKKIVVAHFTVSVDLSDFNNATGIVSNAMNLFLPAEIYYKAYGAEFSPDSKLVYSTAFYADPVTAIKRNALLQYDVSLATPAAIRASKQTISQNSDPIQTYAALQIAPDGKMYMAKNTYTHIAAVSSPNVYGTGCGYVSNAVQFSQPGQSSSFGLPTFIQSYFYPLDSFSYTVNCPGSTIQFNYTMGGGTNSVVWNFGDPASGAANTSILTNPVHSFSSPGTYNVQLVKFTNCGTDTLRKTIVADTLYINLGADTLICGGASLLLNATAITGTNSFLWQDGSTNPSFLATASGLYWVEVRNSMGCIKRDSINVSFKPAPFFNLGADTSICVNDVILLNTNISNANSYLWNTGATTSSIQASQVGLYWCEVNKDGCSFRDSLQIVSIKPLPLVNLGVDLTLCEGDIATLDATYLNSTYLWQDGSTSPVYTVTQQGSYFVTVDLDGCKESDTVSISYNLKPGFTLGPDQFICPGNNIVLSPVVNAGWQLVWQDGSNGSSYTVSQPGTYTLSATNNCGSTADVITVSKGVCKVFMPSAFTPNNDGRNDVFRALGTETVTQFHLKIFNRWGQVVFETTDRTKGWDGRLNGQLSPAGVFVYTLQYSDSNQPGPQYLKGTFVLIW